MVEEIHPPDDRQHPDGRIEHPEVRFERTDADFRWILSIVVVAIMVAAFHFSMIWWFFHRYREHEARIKKSPFPLAAASADSLPKEPRLEQLDRVAGIESSNVFIREQSREETLRSYGLTPEEGFIHIPIDRAMALLADKLPARKEPAEAQKKGNGLVDAGASNSGRLFRGQPK